MDGIEQPVDIIIRAIHKSKKHGFRPCFLLTHILQITMIIVMQNDALFFLQII